MRNIFNKKQREYKRQVCFVLQNGFDHPGWCKGEIGCDARCLTAIPMSLMRLVSSSSISDYLGSLQEYYLLFFMKQHENQPIYTYLGLSEREPRNKERSWVFIADFGWCQIMMEDNFQVSFTILENLWLIRCIIYSISRAWLIVSYLLDSRNSKDYWCDTLTERHGNEFHSK